MSYAETLKWLYVQLPMYQRIGGAHYKIDLDKTIQLCAYLGNPENRFPSIHVAGTNGKGSTSHMLASILQEAGFKVGLYTSPHLKDFRERIKINGKMIPEPEVVDFVRKHKRKFEELELSFFEMTAGMAFTYFAESKVDIAIIETGMGGRLDSTNVVTPLVSIITNIGYDHMQFLGDNLEKIAGEKAGIIKHGVPVVISETQQEVEHVFIDAAFKNESPIFFADQLGWDFMESDLTGVYQLKNQKGVLQAIRILQDQDWVINERDISEGLLHVVANTGLFGRWQKLNDKPRAYCDCAHNLNGLLVILDHLSTFNFEKLHIVLGVVNDKELDKILPIFPPEASYYFCRPDIPRGLDERELASVANKHGLKGNSYPSVQEAYQAALKNASPKDLVFVGGSTFVVAEVV
jgi:dihydrofolate synthase / folylpolyglutamate synthase